MVTFSVSFPHQSISIERRGIDGEDVCLVLIATPHVALGALARDVSVLVAVVAAASAPAESAAHAAAAAKSAITATAAAESATASAATSTATTAEATEPAAAVPVTAAAVLPGLGLVDLDLLAVDGGAVQLLDGLVGTDLVNHGHEGVTLASDVNILDLTTCGEFVLQDVPGAPGVDSINE